MDRLKWPALFAALAASAMGTTAYCGDLTVVEAVWTIAVRDKQYGPKVQPDSPARPIYFWTKLAGGPQALDALKKTGKLPVRHVWRFANVFDSGTAVLNPVQERSFDVGAITDRNGALADLIDQNGQFTWRTWSNKQSVWGGTWTVSVQFADGEPLICSGVPCEWSISLQD